MIKNKIPMVTTILVLAIGFIVLSTNDLTAEASKEEKIISYPGEIIKYDDLNDLEKDAPIIVQATFTGDRETVYPNITEGRLFRSDSLVEIKKVFKGDLNKKDQIVVYEPAYLDENDVFVTIDGYNLMDEKETYTLFLKPVKNKKGYAIAGMYQGKYYNKVQGNGKSVKRSFDYKDLNEVDYFGGNVEHFKRLKEQVVKKYKLVD
ncbi:hypothetical protein [Brevibacillus centrosporus]|uniref:Uncharacterized protein n=1 Tax=Brevibacillus centrosporus TaxID=54910 RepID=A0A1I3YF54_9BACL|nr:hypothetical protein [Brevibacillus centrosporus]MEC2128899.1 hypothetical protein [Brevibacillus centrosporus]MED4910581.1 hypothetical protein [Brevibacillus centrosporus]RNB70239.1 hypothetical protein EDM55_12290 [Brevibacillus centrosporus]SFK30445.1 hypothetical protein SAMN05518846_111104 [Brevibacillus centrosporus]GED34978.1 hypothetical protein BCE02nite_61190 [Brevibacillus centrosporus]